ncbi:carboxypeptidase M32 [Acidisoma cellulosilytica]|uniref:Metal-dependent carboxypeptidase n=1 Tax=Acidisoma cellulosilyticum TaxID=2802395 RepID=A0A963Z159_9PROT|nr:carboxypeptidase M32 [Acidisoma cellulosilyticum]MCB8880646.1 carboxypeptidase M32 [Acidisoma cellulosilyticum]
MTAYDRLATRFARIATVNEAISMLNWDASVMMPPGGAAARGEQLAVLSGLSHELATASALADDLTEAELSPPADPWAAGNLALMRHRQQQAAALPADLVEAQSRANSACESVWRGARQTSDFAAVRPYLAEVVRLTREASMALGEAFGLTPYDALMDLYQRGIGAADVEPIFTAYEGFLADALPLAEAIQAGRGIPTPLPGPFPIPTQEALCRRLSESAGLDYRHARLDTSAHPFSGGTPTDNRITSRYTEDECFQSLMGVMHETGHAMYEAGLPRAYARQPVGEAAGMAAHESQSLLIELQVCRSDAYLSWLGPQLAASFGGDPSLYATGNLGGLLRRVDRGFIRVEANEVTYPAHVILRFRLERALMAGDLSVDDLPGAWNEGMQSLLGITPPDDRRGCLQDIHWYDGAFGYFPSYTLGAMAAAQIMAAIRRAVPDVDEAMSKGDLSPLLGWVRREIHGRANSLGFNDLMVAATGKPLESADFTAHLTARYLTA